VAYTKRGRAGALLPQHHRAGRRLEHPANPFPARGRDFDLIMVNSGMCGVPEMTSALLRMNRPFWVVTSHIDDAAGKEELAAYIQAAGVLGALKKKRIAIAGTPSRDDRPDGRPAQPAPRRRTGVLAVEPEKVSVAMQALPEADVKALVAKERDRYKVDMDAALFERPAAWRWLWRR